jgi:PAS domain S-box-containing protein
MTCGGQHGSSNLEVGQRSMRVRLLSPLVVGPTARPLGLGLVVATSIIVAETLLLDLLKHVAPMHAFGVVYLPGVLVVVTGWGLGLAAVTSLVSALAFDYFRYWPSQKFDVTSAHNWVVIGVFLVVSLSANTLAGLARSRADEAAEHRREADLVAELARLILRASDVPSALDAAAQRVAGVLGLPWAALELGAAPGDEYRCAVPLRDGATVLGTLLVPAGLPNSVRQRLRDRVVPALEALLAAERQRAATNTALEASRKELERFFDLSSDLLGIGRRPANWTRVNPAFERTFGYSRQELLERSFLDFVRPEDLNTVRGVLDDLENGHGLTQFEQRCINRDGSERWLEWMVVPDDGLFYVVGRDVTERQREQDRLREAHQMVEASRDQLGALAEQHSALRRVATLVARGVSATELFSAVATELARCLGVRYSSLWRYEPDGAAVAVAVRNEPGLTTLPVGARISLEGESVAAMVLRTGRVARIADYADAAGATAVRLRELGVRSAVGAPILLDGRVWGVAIVGSGRPEPLPPDTEARVADFGELVATSIANAHALAELTASRARVVTAADEARRRLERDLHDGAQQRLVSLLLQLRMAEASVPSELDALKEQISGVVSGLIGASEDLREISRGIYPAIQSKGGLGPALEELARRSAVPAILDLRVTQRLPDYAEVTIYYVVAEALTNTAKHAQASNASVAVHVGDENLHLLIRDDGVGGADLDKGSGLIGLTDRVEALGGQMQITSAAGDGTSLRVTIPLKREPGTAI